MKVNIHQPSTTNFVFGCFLLAALSAVVGLFAFIGLGFWLIKECLGLEKDKYELQKEGIWIVHLGILVLYDTITHVKFIPSYFNNDHTGSIHIYTKQTTNSFPIFVGRKENKKRPITLLSVKHPRQLYEQLSQKAGLKIAQ